MVSASDILKALDTISTWKAIMSLPDRVAELEARVKALEEKRAARQGPNASDCPKSGARLRVEKEQEHPDLGFAGIKTHSKICDGRGNKATREFHPGTGYR